MKILAFVDVHGSLTALDKIKKKAKNADVLVCAGDISVFEENIDFLMGRLDKIGKPVLMIHGNHEDSVFLRKICAGFKNIYFIHGKTWRKDDYLFIGYGGGGFSLTDPHFGKIGKRLIQKRKKGDKVILVTHAPPYKTRIDLIIDQHCGNKTIRNFIVKYKPELAISGHLHECAGKEDKIGKTRGINPGPYAKMITV